MPWRQTEPMNERARFVTAVESGVFSMSELCREYGISRKTGYKWMERFHDDGYAALEDRSRAPHTCPHEMPIEISELVIQTRKDHPRWGARKLIVHLANKYLALAEQLPSATRAFALLKRSGYITERKCRNRSAHPGCSPIVANAPNDLWSIDFKGQFRTLNKQYCYPLTVTDALSRYLLACDGLVSTAYEGARPVLERLFQECGLPLAIRSDNGAPFCSTALGGLSRLSIWWMKLGIGHQRNRPGKPQDNPRHERMHSTLKQETIRPPAQDIALQQQRFDAFRLEFNCERPHEALNMRTPASIWRPSTRTMPQRLRAPEYASHMQVRSVRSNGEIKFGGRFYFVSELLVNERVALEEIDDGLWSVMFYETLLARLDIRKQRLLSFRPKTIEPNSGSVGV